MAIRRLPEVCIEYIRLVLENTIGLIRFNMQGIIPGISRENILEIFVPLPPLIEQHRIIKKYSDILSNANLLLKR